MPVQTSYSMDPDRGVAGQLDKAVDSDVKSMYNGEASTDMPFGFAVERDTTVATGKAAKLPSNTAHRLAGIVLKAEAYENGPNGELSTTGVKPGGQLNVLREGRICVPCEGGCTAGDRLFVRISGGTGAGALRASDAGGGTCIDATTWGEWQETVTDGQLAWLAVEFINK